jgi:hypothetical protein
MRRSFIDLRNARRSPSGKIQGMSLGVAHSLRFSRPFRWQAFVRWRILRALTGRLVLPAAAKRLNLLNNWLQSVPKGRYDCETRSGGDRATTSGQTNG